MGPATLEMDKSKYELSQRLRRQSEKLQEPDSSLNGFASFLRYLGLLQMCSNIQPIAYLSLLNIHLPVQTYQLLRIQNTFTFIKVPDQYEYPVYTPYFYMVDATSECKNQVPPKEFSRLYLFSNFMVNSQYYFLLFSILWILIVASKVVLNNFKLSFRPNGLLYKFHMFLVNWLYLFQEATFFNYSLYIPLQLANLQINSALNIEGMLLCFVVIIYFTYFYLVLHNSINKKVQKYIIDLAPAYVQPMISDLSAFGRGQPLQH